MAKRLTSRLSAGAAVVTGIGMVGIATAVPAHAATDLEYNCQTPLGAAPFQVSIDTDAPETVVAGETLSIPTITGTVTLDPDTSNAAAGFLGIETLEGTTPAESTVTKDGEEQTATVSTELVTAPTTFWDSEAGTWTQEGIDPANPQVVLPLTGSGGSIEVPADATGTYQLHAPETFTSSFIGTKGDGTEIPLEIPCTYASGDTVIDTVTVTDEPVEEEPTDPPAEEEPTNPPAEDEPTDPPAEDEPVTEEPTEEPTTPEVPAVVQTDGLTPAMTSQEDSTGTLALGGLLLAGAGVGTVLVMRRRAQQH